MTERFIYLDHAATTPVRPEVVEAMLPYFSERFGNPSSLYAIAQEGREGVDEARERVAAVLNCRTSEVVFTGNGTESNNTALKGVARAMRDRGRHIITTAVEHHSVLHPLEQLEAEGFEVTVMPVEESGAVSPEAVADAVRADTVLVSVMMANNEVGSVMDVAEISRQVRAKAKDIEAEVYIHTDAAQAAGKLSLDTRELGVDLLSLTGHKFYSPKGVGILYVKRRTPLEPLLTGGGQERQRRSGTENVPYIVGIGVGLELAEAEREAFCERTGRLREMIESGLLERIPDAKINGGSGRRIPNISNISIPGVEGEPILLGLDFQAIAASSGSACSTASIEPSHVLTAMKIPVEMAVGSIRISLGRESTEEDALELVRALPEVVEKLQSMPGASSV